MVSCFMYHGNRIANRPTRNMKTSNLKSFRLIVIGIKPRDRIPTTFYVLRLHVYKYKIHKNLVDGTDV